MMVTDKITITNEDNILLMSRFPDNHFDLAIVDPPYGIDFSNFNRTNKTTNGTRIKANKYKNSNWDDSIPNDAYFLELQRVSKNQIVWGANNFEMPPSEYFCVWDKKQTVDNFATAEYAWVSMGLKKPAKIFEYSIHKHNQTNKIHPTQKPVALYRWLLQNYANKGDKILDTHLGSGSSRIAADMEGFDFYACELDKDYFESSCKRFDDYKKQIKLF